MRELITYTGNAEGIHNVWHTLQYHAVLNGIGLLILHAVREPSPALLSVSRDRTSF